MSSEQHTPADSITPASGTGAPGHGDGALNMLLEFETRLGGLKKLHEQLSSREQDVLKRDQALASRDQTLAERDAELSRREQALAETQAQAESLRASNEQARAELEREREAQQRAREEQARERAELEASQKRTKDAAEELDAQRREIESARARLESDNASRLVTLTALSEERARKVVEQEKLLVQREQATIQRERAMSDHERRLGEIEAALDQRDLRMTELEEAVTTQKDWLAERERMIAARELEAKELQDRIAADNELRAQREADLLAQAALLDEREQLAESREKRVSDAEKLAAELADREQQLAQRAEAQARQEEELKQREAELERERASVTEQARTLAERASDGNEGAAIWAGRTESLQLELGEARAARAGAETELAQAREEIDRLTSEVRDVIAGNSTAGDELRARDEQISALKEELTTFRRKHEEATDRLARADQEAQKADEASQERARAQDELHKTELAARDEKISTSERLASEHAEALAELQRSLAELRERAERAEKASESGPGTGVSAEDIEQRDHAIVLLRERLERFQAENLALAARASDLETRIKEAAQKRPEEVPAMAQMDEAILHNVERRQHRLRRYKSMLQTQARKIVAAQNALQRRHQDCEMILQQRARLSAVSTELAKREKRVVAAKARSGAFASLLYVTITLGILGVLSWEVSKRVWPGTFIARATLEADTHNRKLDAEQLGAWQRDHEAMIKDPRLMEFAAERMTRRGLTALGTAAELRSRLQSDLYTQSPTPGTMTLELRGEGAERTALELDTFITSLKSLADMSREERANNVGVSITQPATASQEALFEQRLTYAGMVFGGGVAFCSLLGAAVWFRLVRSKKTFDHAEAVQSALEQVDWQALEKTFKKPADAKASGSERKAA